MTTAFIVPGHHHTAARVSSASTEDGLTVGVATPTSTNKGALRLRTSGTPTTTAALTLTLKGGGNPTGYATDGSGASVAWRNTADADASYNRGYVDTPQLHRVEFPVPYVALTGIPSTPRELADGYLGFACPDETGAIQFYRQSPTGTVTTVAVGASGTVGYRCDFARLPSGRLILAIKTVNTLTTRYSDDHGATWASLGSQTITAGSAVREIVCLEYAEDLMLGLVASATAGGADALLLVSRDGGVTFAEIDDNVALVNPRMCVTASGLLCVINTGASSLLPTVYRVAPGGGLPAVVNVGGGAFGSVAIVPRDDGTLWSFSANAATATTLEMECRVSLDDGLTWASVTTEQRILDTEFDSTPYAGYNQISAGTWRGSVVVLARVESSGGGTANEAIHLLTFGGWASVVDSGDPYEHTYVPIERPQNVGWTKADTGVGAVLSAQGPCRITATGAANSTLTAPAAIWAPTSGQTRRIRFRTRIISDGDVTTDRAIFRFAITDGANRQTVKMRFGSGSTTILDDAAGTVLATVTETFTAWTDWLVQFQHESGTNVGTVNVYHRQDDDAAGLWIADYTTSGTITEQAGASSTLVFGGSVAGAVVWEVAWIGVADSSGVTAASTLVVPPGRALPANTDCYLKDGIRVGGFSGAGIPGDTYTLTTTYQYPKEAIWREMRPSRQCRSSADNAAWSVVLDAGSADRWATNCVGAFGTNFRTATLQLNTTDSWGAPAQSISLDATLASFTVGGGGARGPGYVGPTASPSWRPHQYRSDGDGHRFFLAVDLGAGLVVHEIAGNDEDRVYIDSVDLSSATGTAYVFGDRMAATSVALYQYRFARLLVASQDTADGKYRLGTVVLGKRYEPGTTYEHGFVDAMEPNVALLESDSGSRSLVRLGPRQHTLAVQWSNINYASGDVAGQLRDLLAATEGRVFMFWRDTSDVSTAMLVRAVGRFSVTNVWGELTTAVSTTGIVTLEEER